MTSHNKTAMTDTEKIAYLAEFMGWKKQGKMWVNDSEEQMAWCDYATDWTGGRHDPWNPLTDWNHWRQVEERVMENTELFVELRGMFDPHRFKSEALNGEFYSDDLIGAVYYIEADLPTRVDTLIQAHSHLSK